MSRLDPRDDADLRGRSRASPRSVALSAASQHRDISGATVSRRRRPPRWFTPVVRRNGLCGSDAQDAQAVGAAGEDSAGAGVDPHQVLGIERQSLVVDHDGAGAAERDVQLLPAGVGLVMGLGAAAGP